MFQDVGSKVAEEVKLFKTYHPWKKTKKNDDGVDYLINKVQGEIEQNKKQNINNYQQYQQEPNNMNNQNQVNYNQPLNQNYNINNELNNKPEPIPQ